MTHRRPTDRPHTIREKIASGQRTRHDDDSVRQKPIEFEDFEDGDPIVDDDDAWDPEEWEDE